MMDWVKAALAFVKEQSDAVSFAAMAVAAAVIVVRRKGFEVTDSGAFWIHRIQNEYSLAYIERLWGRCRSAPWPSEVQL